VVVESERGPGRGGGAAGLCSHATRYAVTARRVSEVVDGERVRLRWLEGLTWIVNIEGRGAAPIDPTPPT
jgi:hypothetical protein